MCMYIYIYIYIYTQLCLRLGGSEWVETAPLRYVSSGFWGGAGSVGRCGPRRARRRLLCPRHRPAENCRLQSVIEISSQHVFNNG